MMRQNLTRYLHLKRSLGFKFQLQRCLLRGFVAFAEKRGDRFIKRSRVLEWAALAPSPAQRRNRLLIVRRFALVMHAENARHQVPAEDALGKVRFKRPPPFIYEAQDIVRLIQAAAALKPAATMRSLMYSTLFGLLAATGMRISGALALQVEDVTPDGLLVRATKFQKNRLLPLHVTTQRMLARYLAARSQMSTADRTLFVSIAGGRLSYTTVRGVFLRLLDRTHLRGAHSGRDPRIHDLRHTFAVRSLEQCRHEWDAVARHVLALSTYLGHAHVTNTYWHLQATPVLLGQIAEASETLLTGGAA
jgi:integrase